MRFTYRRAAVRLKMYLPKVGQDTSAMVRVDGTGHHRRDNRDSWEASMAGSGPLRRRMALTALLRVFKPGTPGVGRRLAAIPRMIRATMRKEYDGGGRLAMMIMASVYIVSPIDLVPEAIFLVFGLIDDAAVVGYL